MIGKLLQFSFLAVFLIVVTGLSAYWSVTWIIRGEDAVIVPDLTGKDVVYALEILTNLGLNTKVQGYEYNPDIPKNHIIAQEPAPGMERKRGRDVRIRISKGRETLIMPNLQNLTLREVDIILGENGLSRRTVSHTSHPDVSDGRVVSQVPLPGREVKKTDRIDLLVSRGAHLLLHKMPKVIGFPLDEAVGFLAQRHLHVGPVQTSYDPSASRHSVLIQEPAAGYPVRENSTVIITVNQKPGTGASFPENELYPGLLFRHRLPAGILNRHVRVASPLGDMTIEVYNEYLRPGEEIFLFLPDATGNDLIVEIDDKPVLIPPDESWQIDFPFSGLPDMFRKN